MLFLSIAESINQAVASLFCVATHFVIRQHVIVHLFTNFYEMPSRVIQKIRLFDIKKHILFIENEAKCTNQASKEQTSVRKHME